MALAWWAWWYISPDDPRIPAQEPGEAPSHDYIEGGASCDPKRLNALPADKAPDERDRCKQAAEDHRIQEAELSEARRANDLSEWNLRLSAQQARSSAVQTVATVAAFAAAALAAAFAGLAALYAKASATADNLALRATRRAIRDARRDAEVQSERFNTQMSKQRELVEYTAKTALAMDRAAAAQRDAAHATTLSAEAAKETLTHAREEARAQALRAKEQLRLADQTMQFTAKTARAMSDTARETKASAEAMRDVATAMAASAENVVESVNVSREVSKSQKLFGQTQLRAYVSVLIGGAIYQDSQWQFEARPLLSNTGATPARNLRWRIMAAILPSQVPEDFRFPLPERRTGRALLPPQQTFEMRAWVDNRVPDEDVLRIKLGGGEALCVWGYVIYEDVFHRTHRTTFAQQLFWQQSGEITEGGDVPEIVRGIYLSKHNRAN